MPNTSINPIQITHEFSVWLASYLLATHLSALLLIHLLELQTYLNITLMALIIISLVYYWRRDLLRLGANSVMSVEWSKEGSWLLRLKNGTGLKAELCPSSFMSRYIVVLHLKTAGSGKRKIVLPGDAHGHDQLRRLRVLLKMYDPRKNS